MHLVRGIHEAPSRRDLPGPVFQDIDPLSFVGPASVTPVGVERWASCCVLLPFPELRLLFLPWNQTDHSKPCDSPGLKAWPAGHSRLPHGDWPAHLGSSPRCLASFVRSAAHVVGVFICIFIN